MSLRHDRRVKELFERVLDAPESARESVLNEGSVNDAALRAEVSELLAAGGRIGGFLETPAFDRVVREQLPDAQLAPGDTVGDFTITRRLGEGGGGAVYEAEQQHPRRRVALKVLRPAIGSAGALHRFREEAATLASLQHPGIAHVYAAGVLDGEDRETPWIAMELVPDASDIVAFAAERDLSVRERIELLLSACDALHHAHQRGVIHRDVKPANVLVDSSARSKAVDFGIASAAQTAGRDDEVVGTLPYMSPEQLAPGEAGTDVRSDVYGLGVLCYEILSGALPHDVTALSITEAARRISTRPAVPLRERAPDVPADLASIVSRALAPDREERYPSVAALSEDLQRWLTDRPVQAHAGGTLYHMRKFARRRRAATLAIAVVAVTIVVATALSLEFAYDSQRARRRAEFQSYVAGMSAAATALRVHDVGDARRRLARVPQQLRDWEWHHLSARLELSDAVIPLPYAEAIGASVRSDGELIVVTGGRKVDGVRNSYEVSVLDGTGHVTARSVPDGRVRAVALCEVTGKLALGSLEGTVWLGSVARLGDLAEIATLGGAITSLEFSPDGTQLAAGCADGAVALWKTAGNAHFGTLGGHPDRVISLAFYDGGGRLATGCRNGDVTLWDVHERTHILTLSGHLASVDGLDVSPDGRRLASASRDHTVRLWDLTNGKLIAVGSSHTSNVAEVVFDPTGEVYVSASWDGTLRVWGSETGDERGLLRGHEGRIRHLAFATETDAVFSFARDGTARRWNLRSVEVPTVASIRDAIVDVAVHPSGDVAAAATVRGAIWLFDTRTTELITRLGEVEWSPRTVRFVGDRRLVVNNERGTLYAWRWESPFSARVTPLAAAPLRLGIHNWTATPDGRVSWYARSSRVGADLTTDILADANDRASVTVTLPFRCRSIAWHERTRRMAVGGPDGVVVLFRPDDPAERVERRVHDRAIVELAFNDAGDRIVCVGEDGSARVLNADDVATLFVLMGHSGPVTDAAFLPGGRRIVTSSHDATVRLWDAPTGESVLVLHGHVHAVHCVEVSPDGDYILSGGGSDEDAGSTVRVWTAPGAGSE